MSLVLQPKTTTVLRTFSTKPYFINVSRHGHLPAECSWNAAGTLCDRAGGRSTQQQQHKRHTDTGHPGEFSSIHRRHSTQWTRQNTRY